MKPTVAEWLHGKDILITGATGFMGKVLVEKLLRCCEVNRLYLVIRARRGTEANDRLKDLIKSPMYEPLLEKKPNAFDRVTVIPGDMTELECGISKEHQQLLKETVSIIFHTAASVRFDEPLSDALKMNTRGTRELIKLAEQMPQLELFQYVSTTYCNANLNETVYEEVYPSHLDWKILLELLDSEDAALNLLAYKLLWTQPNTYTLSKSLAENVVLEASKELPVVIVRPSVVTMAIYEPVPGWVDNLNGPMSISAGALKGVLRTFKCEADTVLDYLSVDLAINGMIAAAWFKRFHSYDSGELEVFNEIYSDRVPVTFRQLNDIGIKVNDVAPLENYSWYPFMVFTNNTYLFHVLFFLLQLIPALLQDLLLTIAGRKRMLLKLNIKIYNAAMALSIFTSKKFNFSNKKYVALYEHMTDEDKRIYNIEEDGRLGLFKLFSISHQGFRKYIFNEKEEDLPHYRKWHKRLYYIDRVTRAILISLAAWLITSKVSSLLPS